MLKEPTHAFFECDSCGHKSGADARMAAHILPFKRKLPIDARGHCRHCGGERWTISVVYAETDLDAATSALGIAAAATIGVGSIQYSTDTSHLIYPAVPAAIVARINEDPKQRLARLGEYVRTMERSKLKDSGGRDCRTCGTLFVPARGQAWHEAGYCSKVCLVKAEGVAAVAPTAARAHASPGRVAAIEVECPSGHRFEVPRSYAGMIRRCPQCGAHTAAIDNASRDSAAAHAGEFSGRVSERDAEKLIHDFLADVQHDRYRGRIVEFPADRDLPPPERELAFRKLEQLVKSQRWRPAFTSIDVAGGTEDYVTVYLRGGAGEWLALSAGYQYDLNRWQLDSYETSQRSFARSEGESFADYLQGSIADVKTAGRPHPGGVADKDGRYFIEY
jgi:hypothetical protein